VHGAAGDPEAHPWLWSGEGDRVRGGQLLAKILSWTKLGEALPSCLDLGLPSDSALSLVSALVTHPTVLLCLDFHPFPATTVLRLVVITLPFPTSDL
jgi:hypothetical protein